MFNLFSSFDLGYYSTVLFVPFFFMTSLMNFFYFNNTCNNLLNQSSNFFLNFFYSLKIKNFPKISLIVLISIFSIIFFFNFISIGSYNFPVTSQLGSVLWISLSFWVSFNMFSLSNNFKGFLIHFMPKGTPLFLVPFLFGIELISSMIRPITLTVRLVANILAGHLLMILLFSMIKIFLPFFIFYCMLTLVEIFVSLIQAYIFTTMICLYFADAE